MVDDFESKIVGKFKLEEWEDVNYCEHCFYKGEKPLSDDAVLNLLSELTEENEKLKQELNECANHKLYSRRKLEKENKELKQQLDKIPKNIREVWKE